MDYTLRTLAMSLFGEVRMELSAPDVPRRFESSDGLLALMKHAESDAWMSLGIMFELSGARVRVLGGAFGSRFFA